MFSKKNELQDFAPAQNLYCVWIRAHEGENAPLVSLWIDREMKAFEVSLGQASPVRSTEPVRASPRETWTAEDDDPGPAGDRSNAAIAGTLLPLAMSIDSV